MKNKKIMLLGLFVVVLSAFVFAVYADDDVEEKELKLNNVSNITYGSCVSEAAFLKNACFQEVRDIRTSCKMNSQNATDAKVAAKLCNKDFLYSKKQCKVDFKKAKTECKKLNKRNKE